MERKTKRNLGVRFFFRRNEKLVICLFQEGSSVPFAQITKLLEANSNMDCKSSIVDGLLNHLSLDLEKKKQCLFVVGARNGIPPTLALLNTRKHVIVSA